MIVQKEVILSYAQAAVRPFAEFSAFSAECYSRNRIFPHWICAGLWDFRHAVRVCGFRGYRVLSDQA